MSEQEDQQLADIAILRLLDEALDARNPEAFCALWRRFADWHGMHPDFAVVLQEHIAQEAAGMSPFDRIRARMVEKQSTHAH
jgi:hypothetical protein